MVGSLGGYMVFNFINTQVMETSQAHITPPSLHASLLQLDILKKLSWNGRWCDFYSSPGFKILLSLPGECVTFLLQIMK